MPMSDDEGRWWITYNGEVYNFAEVRADLVALGHDFRSHTDTEVVLRAWIQWGQACLHRFIGMFAFAIHDSQTDEVTLVRDRYGKKPLYYGQYRGFVLFSSEMKGVMIGRKDLQIDQQALNEWFLYHNVDVRASHTLVDSVKAVLPGQVLTISPRGLQSSMYYSPLSFVSESEYERYQAARRGDVVQEIDDVLNDAVRLRLVSDVPVGTLLSGGLDSSLITAIAAQHAQDLTAFHVSVAGSPTLDERRYAEQVSRSKGVKLVSVELTGSNFRKALPLTAFLEDLPLTHANSVAYQLISKTAREHGVPVVLTGEGADELFGGYSWNYRRRQQMAWILPLVGIIPAAVFSYLSLLVYGRVGLPISAHRFRDMLPSTVDLIDRYARIDWFQQCMDEYSFVQKKSHREAHAAMLADISDFLSPLLRRLDRMSMGASVEARVPFLDQRLVHKAINLPLEYKLGKRTDKWVLRQVARRYLPSSIAFRRKVGFPLPVEQYLAPLATMDFFADGFCENVIGLGSRGLKRAVSSLNNRAQGLFALIALEIWGRIYFMGRTVDDISALVAFCERRCGKLAQ